MNLLERYPSVFTWLLRGSLVGVITLPVISQWLDFPSYIWTLYVIALFGLVFLWRR